MPDDSLSPEDKTVVVFFETIAFALGWGGVDRFLAGSSLFLVIPILVASISISYAGFKWPQVKLRIKPRFVSTVERIASNRIYRRVIYSMIAALVVSVGFGIHRYYRRDAMVVPQQATVSPKASTPLPPPAQKAVAPPRPAASPPAPLPKAAINFRNSPGSEVNDSKIRSEMPAISGEGGDTKVNRLDYQQTPSQSSAVPKASGQAPSDNGTPLGAMVISGVSGTTIRGGTSYGCVPAVSVDNAPETVIQNSNDHIMPADACVFYYGALRLQAPCYNRNKLDSPGHDELEGKLDTWETGVANFWKGENLSKWNDKFGHYDASKMSIDQMCDDVESDSDKMSFFRLVYYGFEHYPVPNGARP